MGKYILEIEDVPSLLEEGLAFFKCLDAPWWHISDRIINRLKPYEAPQWIPVTERLPKVDESVLVTTEWNDISIAWRIGIDKWFIHEGSTNATTDDIIAWMPLPEPYKED